jgi:hypothetical protein
VAEQVLVSDILGALEMGTGALLTNSLIGAFRIKGLVAYCISGAADVTVSSMSISWLNKSTGLELSGPSQTLEVISTPLYPGILSTVPPEGSLAELWQAYLSDTVAEPGLFSLTLPIGSIVDLTIELSLLQADVESLSNVTTMATTVGEMYAHALDASSSGVLRPVGRTYIA